MPIAVISILLGIFGLILVCLGIHGRVVRRHPCCRRCGYDLHGKEALTICNECGRDLKEFLAVRPTVRARMPRMIICGILIVGLGCAIIPWQTMQGRRSFNMAAMMPDWMLHVTVDSSSPELRGQVLGEIMRRFRSGTIDDEDFRDICLDVISLRSTAGLWPEMYDVLIITAADAGILDAEDLTPYFDHIFNDLRTPPVDRRVWQGSSTRVRTESPSFETPFHGRLDVSVHDAALRNAPQGISLNALRLTPQWSGGRTKEIVHAVVDIADDAPLGTSEFTIAYRMDIHDQEGQLPVISIPVEVTQKLTVLRPDQPWAALDPSLATPEEIRGRFAFDVQFIEKPHVKSLGSIKITAGYLPCQIAGNIVLLVDDEPMLSMRLVARKRTTETRRLQLLFEDMDDYTRTLNDVKMRGRLTVAFQTDIEAAEFLHSDDHVIWDGTVRFDLRVGFPESTEQPTP